MTLTIEQVVKLYEQARDPSFNYMQAPQEYGVACWNISAWNIQVSLARLTVWGPIERWGQLWKETLQYDRIEITHEDFLIELEAHAGALACHSSIADTRSHSSHYRQHFYDLAWLGDASVIEQVFVYHDLVRTDTK